MENASGHPKFDVEGDARAQRRAAPRGLGRDRCSQLRLTFDMSDALPHRKSASLLSGSPSSVGATPSEVPRLSSRVSRARRRNGGTIARARMKLLSWPRVHSPIRMLARGVPGPPEQNGARTVCHRHVPAIQRRGSAAWSPLASARSTSPVSAAPLVGTHDRSHEFRRAGFSGQRGARGDFYVMPILEIVHGQTGIPPGNRRSGPGFGRCSVALAPTLSKKPTDRVGNAKAGFAAKDGARTTQQ